MPTPALRANPTVARASEVWTRKFAAAVRDAAGDGRMTPTKAAAMTGPYADNVQNYFTRTGRSSATPDTLIESAGRYVRSALEGVAGSNGKLSLAEMRTLPADLVDDMLLLRGKAATSSGSGSGSVSLADLKSAVSATDISAINDYGKSFEVTTYSADKSRVDILRDVLGMDDLEDQEVKDSFDSSRGAKAVSDLASELREIGGTERENADNDTEGRSLEKKFTDVADAVAGFYNTTDFKSLELAEHSIAEDGDTEHRVLIARKQDDSWLVLHYTDFPF